VQLLCQPERLGAYLAFALLPLATAAPLMLPQRAEALLPAAEATACFVRCAFEAAPDLSALETGGVAGGDQRMAKVRPEPAGAPRRVLRGAG
jgi:hypothetical protein